MTRVPPKASKPRSRSLVFVTAAVLILGACGDTAGSEEFCGSARTFVTFTADTPLERFLATLDEMVERAPSDGLAADAQILRDGLESAGQGDAAGVRSPEFEEAGARIDKYASENCSAD